MPIDLNVGEAVATYPSLSMNRGGVAYLAYRVLAGNGAADPNAPPGYFAADTRIARYNGSLWSVLGVPADRNQAAPVSDAPPPPNSPKVGIDVSGNGIVAFHEPDDDFVDRVWARRLFGSTLGIALLVSPQEHGGLALRGRGRRLHARRERVWHRRRRVSPAGRPELGADRTTTVREHDSGSLPGRRRALPRSPALRRRGRRVARRLPFPRPTWA